MIYVSSSQDSPHGSNAEPDNDYDDDLDNAVAHVIARARRPQMSVKVKVRVGVKALKELGLAPTEFLSELLGSSEPCFADYSSRLYAKNCPHLDNLFSAIMKHPTGKERMAEWMRPHALEFVCDAIYKEMEIAKGAQLKIASDLTAKDLASWDVNTFIEPETTPTWSRVLFSASRTNLQASKDVVRDPQTVRISMDFMICVLNMPYNFAEPQYDHGSSTSRSIIQQLPDADWYGSFRVVNRRISTND